MGDQCGLRRVIRKTSMEVVVLNIGEERSHLGWKKITGWQIGVLSYEVGVKGGLAGAGRALLAFRNEEPLRGI